MPALASQFILTETAILLRNSAVSYNHHTQNIEYSSIFDGAHEKANTLFYDGIISPPIVSLTKEKSIDKITLAFEYINLINNPYPILNSGKKYIFDINSSTPEDISSYLCANYNIFNELTIDQLIAGFTTNPAQIVGSKPSNLRTWWQNTDLIQKKITHITKISVIKL